MGSGLKMCSGLAEKRSSLAPGSDGGPSTSSRAAFSMVRSTMVALDLLTFRTTELLQIRNTNTIEKGQTELSCQSGRSISYFLEIPTTRQIEIAVNVFKRV